MNRKVSFSIWYVFLAIWAVILLHDFFSALNKVEEIPYSRFKTLVAENQVIEVAVSTQTITGKTTKELGQAELGWQRIQAKEAEVAALERQRDQANGVKNLSRLASLKSVERNLTTFKAVTGDRNG